MADLSGSSKICVASDDNFLPTFSGDFLKLDIKGFEDTWSPLKMSCIVFSGEHFRKSIFDTF